MLVINIKKNGQTYILLQLHVVSTWGSQFLKGKGLLYKERTFELSPKIFQMWPKVRLEAIKSFGLLEKTLVQKVEKLKYSGHFKRDCS